MEWNQYLLIAQLYHMKYIMSALLCISILQYHPILSHDIPYIKLVMYSVQIHVHVLLYIFQHMLCTFIQPYDQKDIIYYCFITNISMSNVQWTTYTFIIIVYIENEMLYGPYGIYYVFVYYGQLLDDKLDQKQFCSRYLV